MLNADMIYEAADYLRLSKEDGDFSLSNDKLESDSIQPTGYNRTICRSKSEYQAGSGVL